MKLNDYSDVFNFDYEALSQCQLKLCPQIAVSIEPTDEAVDWLWELYTIGQTYSDWIAREAGITMTSRSSLTKDDIRNNFTYYKNEIAKEVEDKRFWYLEIEDFRIKMHYKYRL